MSRTIEIVAASPALEAGWRELWSLYCGDESLSECITSKTWEKILEPSSSIGAYIAHDKDTVVGFLTYVTHDGTWEIKPICYIEDLYIAKTYRGDAIGVGVALANVILDRLKASEWSRVYGITSANNLIAQRLYNKFADGKKCLRYVLKGGV